MECAAIHDILLSFEAIDPKLNRVGKTNLKRIVSMLTRLSQRTDSVSEEATASPLTARYWFYLGQTYDGLQQYRQAVEAFDQCIRLDDWADESSWACYLAARCLVSIREYREAEEYCALGMSRKPTMAELPWLAGWCCFQRGAMAEAIAWSRLAITLAQNTSARNEATFRYMPA